MLQRKVTHEIKLPISLTIILGLIAVGLMANVSKPVLNIEEAFAANEVQKIAVCTASGSKCVDIERFGGMNALTIHNYGN